ncbi:MAG: signal peptidase II [Deltaproteobacteria bacterium]|nr:signal peptidase II [Deltaproteobacteria bacterium]
MRLRLALLICSLVLLVGCDHATKHWAETSLRAAPRVEVLSGVLDLRYAANHDSAFSLSRLVIPKTVKRPILIALGCVGVTGLVVVWTRRRRARWWEHTAYLLLVAGAVGNVGDRVVRGYVVDFIHLHHWPIFNVADVLLVAGMVLLALSWRRSLPRPPPTGVPEPAPPAGPG